MSGGELNSACTHLLAALRAEMDLRPGRFGLSWIESERFAITASANEWALAHGRPPITMSEVEEVEQLAVGHVDYASKLALYVAELVVPCGNPSLQKGVAP